MHLSCATSQGGLAATLACSHPLARGPFRDCFVCSVQSSVQISEQATQSSCTRRRRDGTAGYAREREHASVSNREGEERGARSQERGRRSITLPAQSAFVHHLASPLLLALPFLLAPRAAPSLHAPLAAPQPLAVAEPAPDASSALSETPRVGGLVASASPSALLSCSCCAKAPLSDGVDTDGRL